MLNNPLLIWRNSPHQLYWKIGMFKSQAKVKYISDSLKKGFEVEFLPLSNSSSKFIFELVLSVSWHLQYHVSCFCRHAYNLWFWGTGAERLVLVIIFLILGDPLLVFRCLCLLKIVFMSGLILLPFGSSQSWLVLAVWNVLIIICLSFSSHWPKSQYPWNALTCGISSLVPPVVIWRGKAELSLDEEVLSHDGTWGLWKLTEGRGVCLCFWMEVLSVVF